jgi:hypothetical protein
MENAHILLLFIILRICLDTERCGCMLNTPSIKKDFYSEKGNSKPIEHTVGSYDSWSLVSGRSVKVEVRLLYSCV